MAICGGPYRSLRLPDILAEQAGEVTITVTASIRFQSTFSVSGPSSLAQHRGEFDAAIMQDRFYLNLSCIALFAIIVLFGSAVESLLAA